MGLWAWVRPGNRIWKVVSDYEKGTITVYDEKGNIVLEKQGLDKDAIAVVEKNFLDITATNLTDKSSRSEESEGEDDTIYEDNPMYG